jgi:hypothetical protein
VFTKIFKLKADLKLFEYILEKTLPNEKEICASSSNLSLFFVLKGIFLEHFKGQSKKHEELLTLDILSNKKMLGSINGLIRA